MGFPLSQSVTKILYKDFINDDEIALSKIIQILNTKNIEKLTVKNKEITFISRHSLFNYKYGVNFTLNKVKGYQLKFEYDLNILLKIILLVIIATAFFSRYSISGYLIFCGIFALGFYYLNILFINAYFRNILNDAFPDQNINFSENDLVALQQEWLKSTDHCPGCGTIVTLNDHQCPECGLKLDDKKSPLLTVTTRYKNKIIRYLFKGKPSDLIIKYRKVDSKRGFDM
jgi:hypothetical protein